MKRSFTSLAVGFICLLGLSACDELIVVPDHPYRHPGMHDGYRDGDRYLQYRDRPPTRHNERGNDRRERINTPPERPNRANF
ncbi:MAG: hypothetical protein HGA31_01755 [Candidatus Moranbacteria bacterium]|nr:hypothetical protein [Candidatus Moranbacteria bacterium]